MKIKEFIIAPKESKDTTSCDTISSATEDTTTQDIVPQNNVPEKIMAEMVDGKILEMPDHSAIAEGVSQIFRRQKGGKPSSSQAGWETTRRVARRFWRMRCQRDPPRQINPAPPACEPAPRQQG